jgi:manganese transport protein
MQASKQAAKSLPEVYASIAVPRGGSVWRRMFAFFGPGYLVAVGYMDPGNWATALAGGASFGYTLLAVALLSNLMAILLQSLCARLGIGAGRDLAQACRDYFPKPVAVFLWILAEAAIIATDLAEVIGTAIGLNLLFDIPIQLGVIVTAFDVFLILMLQRLGFRWIEAFIISLSVVITACFAVQLGLAQPEFAAVMSGFIPRAEIITNPQMLYIALGILGATVMPHNLYLHSAIVQTRAVGDAPEEKRSAIRFATVDSTIALLLALFTNASILILSAAAFHQTGHAEITDLREAHTLLSPLLGTSLAATLFAVALLCCGLNSTVTATMAGQVVMEGFINVRLPPWLRRLVTRLVAIIPAIAVLMIWGEEKTGELLVLSQVILSLQLPFAIIPLVMFTASKKRMGALVAPRGLSLVAALIAVIIVALNVKMLIDVMSG